MYAYDAGVPGRYNGNAGQSSSGGTNGSTGGGSYGYGLSVSGEKPYRDGAYVKVKVSASAWSTYYGDSINITGTGGGSAASSSLGSSYVNMNGGSTGGSTIISWNNPGPFTTKTISFSWKHYEAKGESTKRAYADYTTGAITTPMSVDLTLNANGGTVSQTGGYVYYGQTYGDMPVPTKTGYDFDGWYTASTGGSKITSSTTVSTTSTSQILYAHWTPHQYIITFDANGGSVSPNVKNVAYAGPYGELPTPTRPGYKFLGWYDDRLRGNLITSDTIMNNSSNHSIYAHWEVMTIFRRVQNGSMEMYPLVFIKEGNNVSQATGLYIVENGTGYTCV